ncbi:MAG: hypothetical protein CBD51_002425 [Flavobacteriales bacterium TMED191]|nr:MAG: hypothetical protein CBD51_002425 [Flavobacteriales bacterium TMED191]|tara:strand:+ start:5154 stop:5921 length:768 start_codon:yes stop_codon:yes gene_type:complete
MRKLFFLILVPLLNFGQQTFVPDDAFEQALINFNIDPNPILDDSVPTAIISTLANLAIDNKGINDLTGIEDFIYLDYLNCEGNNLEELNLSGNSLLTFLDCSNNNLNELSLTNNALLNTLNCSNNNLNNLNISNCIELSHLQCDNNNLNELDVSNNTELIGLTCTDNDLDCIQVWNVDFVLLNQADCSWSGQMDCFQKDEIAIWSLDCNLAANTEESLITNPVKKSFNLLGKDTDDSYFIFEIYEDGSVKKYLKF